MPMRRSLVRVSISLLAALGPLAVSMAAHAETCGDQVCPKNWECKSGAVATPDIACAPDSDCEAAEPSTVLYCSPLPCSTDADCAADMVCYSESHSECNDPPPCAKGADCAAPADTTCTTVTQSACVPRYVPPCQSDSDCGTGFTCEEQEECSCGGSTGSGGGSKPGSGSGSGSAGSGSAGTPSDAGAAPSDDDAAEPTPGADGGSAEPPPDSKMAPDAGAPVPSDPPECTCTPSGVKACKLTVVGCAAASDCPSGFTCEDNPSGSCWASSDGSSGCDVPDPAKICAPPYTDLLDGARADDAGGELGIPGSNTDPSDPEPPKGSATGGSGATGGNGATDGNNVPAEHASDNASGRDVVTHGGCAIASTPRTSNVGYGLLALGLAGLFGARRRRR